MRRLLLLALAVSVIPIATALVASSPTVNTRPGTAALIVAEAGPEDQTVRPTETKGARSGVMPDKSSVQVAPDDASERRRPVRPGATKTSDWPSYGGDPGGTRYSRLTRINRDNVKDLVMAWTYRTGDASGSPVEGGECSECHGSSSKFEATPILNGRRLYLSTPLNRAIAMNPRTGEEMWFYDPGIKLDISRNEDFVSRGVSFWQDSGPDSDEACWRRVFLNTVDARLIALDGATGALCEDFGNGGVVRLDTDVGNVQEGQYGVTSPPVIVGDIVIVGSAIGDNRRVDLERGTVRAFDVRTGDLIWSWDPIPRSEGDAGWEAWEPDQARVTGAGNAWAPMSADPERDMIFLPTGSASPDFYGGERIGDNRYANSIVALKASTGEMLWSYQVVHHDLWDYDVSSQPALITVPRDGQAIPAVAVATKMGFIFILDRETGEPLFPVEERPVPQSHVAGEEPWPTQPFPVLPAPLHPLTIGPDDAWGLTSEDEEWCRARIAQFRNEGIFTPPSLEGTLLYPGYLGGVNWGSMAFDPESSILVTAVNRLPMWVRLEMRTSPQSGNMVGTPYTMSRAPLLSESMLPCTKPPWSTLVALSMMTGELLWEVPFGTVRGLEDVEGSDEWGSVFIGGPIVTAGGVVFIAAAMDDNIRAFDLETGEELWKAPLPAGGQATPMTYEIDGKQYLVICAGGHGGLGTTTGDYVVAFSLP